MKIALINGQNHKGSTYHIGRMLAEKLAPPEDIEEVFLPRDMPEFCRGCTKCVIESETLCPDYKYTKHITGIMDSADVLIFTTPVYVFHASGSMKAFLDHLAYRWMPHRPEGKMFTKQAVCITTAWGAGMKSACKDVKDSLFYWGAGKIYSCRIAVMETSWERVSGKIKTKAEKKTDIISKKIKRRYGKVKPSPKTRFIFYAMRLMHKGNGNPADNAYWKEKGWDKKVRPWKAS